jgi:3-hydroxyacyl-[acyl-carrier-protein] dehydratase
MIEQELILPFEQLDLTKILVDQDGLRSFNAHRFEMEQLTSIVYRDPLKMICVGCRDVREDEFWVRGNFPGKPVLPSVLLCESAAQLCCYFVQTLDDFGTQLLALAALDDVIIGRPVTAGQQVVMVGQVVSYRPRMLITWRFQGFVEQEMVCSGILKGVPLPRPNSS